MESVNGNRMMDTHMLKLSGPLCAGQSERVAEMFEDAARSGVTRVIVDLEDVPMIDSRGLAVLLAAYRRFGGDADRFRLAAVQDQPRFLFQVCHLDDVFQTIDRVR